MKSWDELSMAERADVMKLAIEGGVYDLDAIRSGYNEYARGGKIHIDPSKKGTFTAAASKHGKSVYAFASQVLAHPENYSTAMRKKANFARNASKWKHGDGGNLYGGDNPEGQQMKLGLNVKGWPNYTTEQILANAERIEQQKRVMEEAVARRANNYLTTSNDATSVAVGRARNQHLTERAVEGAKAHRAWEEEHPVATQWGNVLGTVPFAVAAYPLAATAGSGIAALGNAAAATSAGQAITAGLAPLATAASTSVAGAPLYTWADVGLSSLFGAHSAETAIEEGGVSPETALGLLPITQVAKPAAEELQAAANWRPWVPRDASRYYRIVGESGDPIGDAIQSGVVRGPGANPNARASMEATMETKPIRLATKAHSYPMFSKGKPWEGSTSRVDGKSKPIIIRSKADTGPVKWEESNVDFSHKGHKGIFRPNYYGELNSTPTRYFEYWEPKRFGYMKREFPVDTNPYHNLMGKGYTVDRGNWMESDLGVEGEKFGEYIGSGGEQTVFQDVSNPSSVLKVYHDTYTKNPEGLQDLVNDYLRRNSIPLQQPASFTGYVKQDGYVYPVFNQGKLLPLGSMSSTEFNAKYLPLLQESLKPYGYTGDGISSEFTNGINTLVDIKPENMGLTPTGELRFLDVDWVTR